MRRFQLNDRQRLLLARIGAGDTVTSRNSDLAVSVYALRSRGLVVTPRSDGVWTAVLTDAGKYFLEHGHHPEDARQSPTTAPASRDRPAGKPVLTPDEVLATVREAGGVLTIQAPDAETRKMWRRAVWALRQSDQLPEDQQLRYSGRDGGDFVVRLVTPGATRRPAKPSGSADATAASVPSPSVAPQIRVPDRLVKPHPFVRATRDHLKHARRDPDGRLDTRGIKGVLSLQVSKALVPRALRLFQGLLVEAKRRGYAVRPPSAHDARGVRIVVQDHEFEVTIVELLDRHPHTPTAEERRRAERHSWVRIPDYDSVPSGRLQIRLPHAWGGSRYRWADGVRSKVEEKLAGVLSEIEERAQREEMHRLERQRQEEERLRAHERAVARARERMIEEERTAELRDQVERWRLATDVRNYCHALRSCVDGELDSAQIEWIAWAEAYADRVDPLERPPRMPEVPELPDYVVERWMLERRRSTR